MTSNLPASEPLSSVSPASSPRPRQVLKAGSGGASLNFHEIWSYRDLLWALSSREIKLRYRQTLLGVLWVVIQPVVSAGILSFVFNKVANLSTGNTPPFLFSFAGLLIWTAFSGVLTKASSVLVSNAALISKVYFPRLCLPLSVVPPILLDVGVSLVVLAIAMLSYAMLGYHVMPTAALLLWPLVMIVTLTLALGLSFMLAALMVSYRDVQYILPFILQLLLFASPISYSSHDFIKKLPQWAHGLYYLNPLVGLLEASRYCLVGNGDINPGAILYSVIASGVIFALGMKCFRSLERKFADVI